METSPTLTEHGPDGENLGAAGGGYAARRLRQAARRATPYAERRAAANQQRAAYFQQRRRPAGDRYGQRTPDPAETRGGPDAGAAGVCGAGHATADPAAYGAASNTHNEPDAHAVAIAYANGHAANANAVAHDDATAADAYASFNTFPDAYTAAVSYPDPTAAHAYAVSAEREKYVGIYQDAARAHRYGHTCHGKAALPIVERWQPDSVVDIGCGWNEFANALRNLPNQPKHIVGVDFACPGADVIADAQNLPFKRKQFDVLTAFDMLEHLRPEQVDAVLAEMERVSHRFVFSISYVDSVNRWQGQTLHPTVRPQEWWMRRLIKAGAGELRVEGHYITGRWMLPVLKPTPDTRCVLVGNGPSLIAHKLGAVIDGFEEIVRFNGCRVRGFEEHTGSRTTLWSTFGKGTVPADPDMNPERVIYIHGEMGHPSIAAPHVYRIPAHWFAECRRRVQEVSTRADAANIIPSSGLLVASWFLEVLGLHKLALAGFDHFSKAHSKQHHYWLPKAFGRPKEHDGDAEALLFAGWKREGRLQILC